MCSPCQSDRNRLQKIQNDVECMLLLQEAINPHGMNYKLICAHADDFEVEVLEESYEELEPQHEPCGGVGHQRASHHGVPSEGVLIKLAYSPKTKPSCKSIAPCLKHTKSLSPCRESSRVESRHKVITARGREVEESGNKSQEAKCMRNKLKEMEDNLKAEREAKMAVINEVECLKSGHERLKKENCQLKIDVDNLTKVKEGSTELLKELASLKEERNELRSLVDDQKDIINCLKRKYYKLNSESKKMHKEGEDRVQELECENSKLSNEVQSLNSTLTCMKKEMQLKEGKRNEELSSEQVCTVRGGKEKLNEQANVENELCCLRKSLLGKEKMLKISNDQQEVLKSELCKAREAKDRSISLQHELENSLNEVKEKLMNSEAFLKNTQHDLCRVKKDLERKEADLQSKLEQKEKEIAALNQENCCLKRKLCEKSTCSKKKQADETFEEGSLHMSVNEVSVRECMAANENKSNVSKACKRTSMRENECEKQKLCALQEELERTRKALEQEKQESEKKCMLIKELHGNIMHLKENESCRIQELQKSLREKEEAERSMKLSFSQERRQNEKLLDELTELKWQEKKLSKQLAESNAQIVQYESSMNIGNECMEHSRMLDQIEEEVEMKTAQWKDYVKRLTKERDDAIRAAKFASEKLMSSVGDFQRHVAMQRKVQNMLTNLLHQRESELKVAACKISKLKADALNNVHNALSIRKKY